MLTPSVFKTLFKILIFKFVDLNFNYYKNLIFWVYFTVPIKSYFFF